MLEIESQRELLDLLDTHPETLTGLALQALDLRPYATQLESVDFAEAILLGCLMDEKTLDQARAQGALIFPTLKNLPFRAFRNSLYTREELMSGYQRGVKGSFARDSHDSAIYQHFRVTHDAKVPPIINTLAQHLHDHSIEDALNGLLHKNGAIKVVAIMGGHSMTRDASEYFTVAEISRDLTRRGFLIATGGGPGAMEAGNLGAYLAPYPDDALDQVIKLISGAPSYKDEAFLDLAFDAIDLFPEGGESLAIPTWFYGHEPTNLFAHHVAKYFSNSLREDGLLAIAKHGVIFAPGSAGTIQEVFMDLTQNHYGTFKWVSPMVFFGHHYWHHVKPVFPLVDQLSHGKQYRDLLTIQDDPQQIVSFILNHPPVLYKSNDSHA